MNGEFLFGNVFFVTLRAGDGICSVMLGVKLLDVRHQDVEPCKVIVADFTGIVFIH